MAIVVNSQSELLREPNLLIPGKKPVGSVKIDWQNNFSSGLQNLLYPIGPTFHTLGVGKSDWSVTGVPIINTAGGQQGIQINGDESIYVSRIHEDATGPVGEWTLFLQCILNETIGANDAVFGFCEEPEQSGVFDRVIKLDSGVWSGYVYDGSAETAETSIAQSIGTLVTMAMSCTSSLLLCGIKSGADIDTASEVVSNTGYSSYSSVELSLGACDNIDNPDQMTVFIAGYANRSWSESEILMWINDPYQFLIPA